MPTLPTWRPSSDQLRRVFGWLMFLAVVLASAQIAVALSRKTGGGLTMLVLIPVALAGLYLLLTQREWLLMLVLAIRAAIDPILLVMQRDNAGMGPGALINAALILLTALYFIRQPRLMARAHVLAWLPFLAIAIMATRSAPDVAKASRVLMVLMTYAAMFALPTVLIRTPQDARRWLWLLLAASLEPTIAGIADMLTGGVQYIEPDDFELGDAMAAIDQKGFRIQGAFGHPNMYAFYLLTMISVLLYAMRTRLFGQSAAARWTAAGYMAIQLVMLVATQTRSAWAVALLMFLAYGLFIDRRMLMLLALAPLAALLVPAVQDRVLDVLSSTGHASDGQLNSYGWRLAMWRSAMPWIRDEWLLGWGLDSYTTYSTTFFPLEYLKGYDAHNVYVQMAFEIGVPGAVAFTAIFVCLLGISLSFIRERTLEAVLLFSLTLGFLMSCYSDNMHRYLTANWYTFFVMSLFVMIGTMRPAAGPQKMKLAYLVNQYPKVSHSFIRREILALEARGLAVTRYALRGWDAQVVDPADETERQATRYLLRAGAVALLRPTLAMLARRPAAFASALAAALRRWRAGDRSLPVNLVTLAEACQLIEWMRADRVTHLHAHFGTNAAMIALLARLLGGPDYSFTVHGPEEWDGPMRIGLPEKIAHARFVVAISSYTRSQLCRWAAPQHMAKLAIVRCGLESSFHDQSPPPVTDVNRFVCIGRLCTDKAQLLLVEAVGDMVRRGIDVELVLAGDGETRPLIEAAISRLGLASRVRITGWISSAQVRTELLAARAMVLPSFAEGLPVVIMEALALRRPVLSTYIAGIPELVQPGVNGWLFPAGSIDGLVSAMTECLATPVDRLQAMGQAGREQVLARHDIGTEAARLAALLEPGR